MWPCHEGAVCDYSEQIDQFAEAVPEGVSTGTFLELARELSLSEVENDRCYISQVFVGPDVAFGSGRIISHLCDMKREAEEQRSDREVPIEVAISPYETEEWVRLKPGERLQRSWDLRLRLEDPAAVHDRKLFPQP